MASDWERVDWFRLQNGISGTKPAGVQWRDTSPGRRGTPAATAVSCSVAHVVAESSSMTLSLVYSRGPDPPVRILRAHAYQEEVIGAKSTTLASGCLPALGYFNPEGVSSSQPMIVLIFSYQLILVEVFTKKKKNPV